MSIVTKYTDYHISAADFFLAFIQDEINRRDISGATAKRTPAIKVSGEHPLIKLTGSLIETGTPDFAGLIPAISVIEGEEREELTTMGDGTKTAYVINDQFITDLRTNFGNMKTRVYDGIITDDQIAQIELALANNSGKLFVINEAFWQRESVFVSLWAHSVQERRIVGMILRSVIYDLRKRLRANDVRDLSISTSKGLVNFDFGKILHGQETEISFLNKFTNYTVTTEVPLADADGTEIIIHGQYESVKHDGFVEIWEGEYGE